MQKQIENAIGDIELIKQVIEKTQKDFSKLSSYFIWIGIINFVVFLAEQVTYFIRNTFGYSNQLYFVTASMVFWMPLFAYIICFIIYYRKTKHRNNDIITGMLKIWGMVLICSQILARLYIYLIPAGNNDKINTLWRCQEIILVLPVIFALFMTGILVQKKLITIFTAFYSIVYFVSFMGMKEVPYGTLGGVGTRVSLSSILIKVLMICVMIALGIYLKRGDDAHGDKFNTGSISDEA